MSLAGLRSFLDASPSPFHAVAAGVAPARGGRVHGRSTRPRRGPRRSGGTTSPGAARWWRGRSTTPAQLDDGFRLVGAHTDSPNLRIKPRPDTGRAGYRQLGVEVYGGVLLNSWLDRDLGLSGRVAVRGGATADATVAPGARSTGRCCASPSSPSTSTGGSTRAG